MTYSNSYGGNPVSCTIGTAVLDVIKNESLLESAANVGKSLLAKLKGLMAEHEELGDIRGMGLSIVLEMITDKVCQYCLHRQSQ